MLNINRDAWATAVANGSTDLSFTEWRAERVKHADLDDLTELFHASSTVTFRAYVFVNGNGYIGIDWSDSFDGVGFGIASLYETLPQRIKEHVLDQTEARATALIDSLVAGGKTDADGLRALADYLDQHPTPPDL